ncbi:PIN domain-containing protein [Pedobacter gandavensis]|uniref:DUF4935 domain-containing protein n=1 Tax=Pedobacter gandavensis TaxID=2679963 RepID=A0ABR6EUP5_9SPHI|nr:PIN domain-containing protein [Pedobacter gandavensis]MBB2148927.1 hypothetical protein [Pedobacter gandavensis]
MRKPSLLHVVLDSNQFRKDITFSKTELVYIKKLGSENLVQLHIPWMIYKESTSNSIKLLNDDIKIIVEKLKGFKRKGMHELNSKEFVNIADQINEKLPDVTPSVERLWSEYIKESKAILYENNPKYFKPVFDNYFTGGKPFQTLKNRADIPDAFIYQNIMEISAKNVVYFISEDIKFTKQFSDLSNVVVFKEISGLFESECFKGVKAFYEKQVELEVQKLALLERKEEINILVLNHIDEADIFDIDDDDSAETTIYSLDEIHIEIIESEINIIGELFYVPIKVSGIADIGFLISKSEVISMQDSAPFSVEEWNDNLFLASQENVRVSFNYDLTIPVSDITEEYLDIEFGSPENLTFDDSSN